MIGRYDARPHASAIAPAAGGTGDRVVDRRAFIGTLTGSLLATPLAVEGQQAGPVARIGFLGATSPSSWASRVEAFRSGLSALGYVEGKNLVIEFRWAEEKYSRLPDLAAELVRLKVDVLVTYGTPATLAAKQALMRLLARGHGAPTDNKSRSDGHVDATCAGTTPPKPIPG
jgi:hypothetical protein